MKFDPEHLAGQLALETQLADMRASREVPAWRWIIRLSLLCLLLTEVGYFWK